MSTTESKQVRTGALSAEEYVFRSRPTVHLTHEAAGRLRAYGLHLSGVDYDRIAEADIQTATALGLTIALGETYVFFPWPQVVRIEEGEALAEREEVGA